MESAPPLKQSIPRDGNWTLVGPYDKRSGTLIYEHRETGQRITVPNIWYNQPVEVRIETMEWYAERRDEHAAKARADAAVFPRDRDSYLRTAEIHDDRAKHLRALAAEMRRTGNVLA